MALLIIDKNKCEKDGVCARECPAAVIRLSAGEGYPEIVRGGEMVCNRCGHCVAACPHGALSHTEVPIEASPEILEKLRIDAAQAEQFLRTRRSVRVFKDLPVEKEKIQKLIEVARYAPTGGNSQMIEWTVITDKARIKKISGRTVEYMRDIVKDPAVVAAGPYLPMIVAAWDAGYDSILRNAPAVVVASAPEAAVTGQTDLTIALAYLELMAPAVGLGACWAGLVQGALAGSSALKSVVGIPLEYPHHYPMMLGYNDTKYFRMPERKAPKVVFL